MQYDTISRASANVNERLNCNRYVQVGMRRWAVLVVAFVIPSEARNPLLFTSSRAIAKSEILRSAQDDRFQQYVVFFFFMPWLEYVLLEAALYCKVR